MFMTSPELSRKLWKFWTYIFTNMIIHAKVLCSMTIRIISIRIMSAKLGTEDRSPKDYHVTLLWQYYGTIKSYLIPGLALVPTQTHNPCPHPNPNPGPLNVDCKPKCSFYWRAKWPEQLSPWTPQGKVFDLHHVGWIGISWQNYATS